MSDQERITSLEQRVSILEQRLGELNSRTSGLQLIGKPYHSPPASTICFYCGGIHEGLPCPKATVTCSG